MKNIFFLFILMSLSFSCQFHVTELPGPQFSHSIDESKKNETFICEYKLPGNRINGIKIKAIIAEKKHTLDGGFFSKIQIDSSKSQLVIISEDYLVKDGKGFGVNWGISGFDPQSGKIAYKNYDVQSFPNLIPIEVISIKNYSSTQVINKLTLSKIINK